jgi:hypothetical protein
LLRVNGNGEVEIKSLMDIQNDVNIISFKESSDGMNEYILGIAKGAIHIGNAMIGLPDLDQVLLFKWSQNQLVWYKSFSQSGIDIQTICMENMGEHGIALGLNVNASSNLFKTDPFYYNSIGSDIVILKYDTEGNLVYQKRFGSTTDDEIIKEMYYSEENVLYLGGELKGTSSIRPVGDLDLIKTKNIQNAAFISYIDLNTNVINSEPRYEGDNLDHNNIISILRLLPNPVNDQLIIEFEYAGSEKICVEVYDLTGNLIKFTPVFNSNNIILNTNQLSCGMYILKLKDDFGHMATKRFIKI